MGIKKYTLILVSVFISSCSSVIKTNDKFNFDNKNISSTQSKDITQKIKELKILVNTCGNEKKNINDIYSFKQNINTSLNLVGLAMGTANTVSIGYSAIDPKTNLNFLNLIFSALNTATGAIKTIMPLEKELPELKKQMDENEQKISFINKYLNKYEAELANKDNIEVVLLNINNDCKFSDSEKNIEIEIQQKTSFDIKSILIFSTDLDKKYSILNVKKQEITNKLLDLDKISTNLTRSLDLENITLKNLTNKKDNIQNTIKTKKDSMVLERDKSNIELLKK
jgi:hypothetical protein